MLTRRGFLAGGAALLGMPSIARAQICTPLFEGAAPDNLVPPTFDKLIRNAQRVIGVRPHRIGGFRLETEGPLTTPKGVKFIVHNYGHSGAGITLSWGCAAEVVEKVKELVADFEKLKIKPNIAVIGAGVIGLTSATELRNAFRTLPVTVYSDTWDLKKTTSYKAGGQFEPSMIYHQYNTNDERRRLLKRYVERSAARICWLQRTGEAASYGIAARRNFTLNEQAGFDFASMVVKVDHQKLPLTTLQGGGFEYRTWLINPQILLPKLAAQIPAKMRVTKRFRSREEIEALPHNIIINCTGFGAKALFEDRNLQPRRGHLILLRNPQKLRYFFSGGCGREDERVISYMFARQDDIVIGGTLRDASDGDSVTIEDDDKPIFDRMFSNIKMVFAGQSDQCRRLDTTS
ncbi:FAD dependent oxidoreductase [Variibacter gotjawalensis]|uniref:FAD dependent oxidoreductase n=1 Tax=Variibacter gotjawalensis TaxID=1333996 RepID=A0A0S3PPB9_9BRAD|nr:FAD-dependent oxidoreductase [Variibacter gotjawalensis]NIK48084.1 glycine/D-amino acid oxidase-like deaminating enzyme [Variibacter gotjawalensis]RZS49960.1 glycine/D-amino acid oxidase-like deaminating enzyme [Variibacter gotjawalensis]BAT57787.1 FAD dependent oxidoreductase [Variibacter gotjawalensis]